MVAIWAALARFLGLGAAKAEEEPSNYGTSEGRPLQPSVPELQGHVSVSGLKREFEERRMEGLRHDLEVNSPRRLGRDFGLFSKKDGKNAQPAPW